MRAIAICLLLAGASYADSSCRAEASSGQPFSYPLRPTDVIGVPDALDGTLITPEGYLFTGWTEVLFFAGDPLQPTAQRLRRLAEGYLPIVEYQVRDGPIRFDFTIFTSSLSGTPSGPLVNWIRVVATNPGAAPARARFAIAQRYANSAEPREVTRYRFRRPAFVDTSVPYEKLPYDQRYYMGGEAFRADWQYEFGNDSFARDGRALFLFPPGGERFAFPGQPYHRPYRMMDAKPDRVAGMAAYHLALAPNGSTTLIFKMPVRPTRELDGIRAADFDSAYRTAAAGWKVRLLSGLRIEAPEPKVTETFKASLAYCYLGRDYIDGDYRQTPGKLNYRAFYLRDGSVFAQAYDLTGHPADARKVLDYFLKWQQPDGNFVSDMWDGWGQTLWIFGEHAELNRDREFAAKVYPAVLRAIQWLEEKRGADPYRIFPAGPVLDAEYLKGRHGHVTGWNFLGLGGLRGAMKLARLLGKPADVHRFESIYKDWKAAFERRLNEIAPRIGGRIPPGLDDPTGQDGATWFNLNGIYPVEVLDPRDARVTATLEWSRGRYLEGVARWEGNDRVRAAGGPPRVHAYLTAANTESALLRGEQEQAVREFYAMLAHTTSTHGASEQVLPGTRDPAYQPQPHGWFAANYIVLLRHMLLRERGDDLHVLSAVSPAWLAGPGIRVHDAPTTFGLMDFTVTRAPGKLTVQLEPKYHTPLERVVVHVPWFLRSAVTKALADGRATQLAPGARSVSLSPRVRKLQLTLRESPPIPDPPISYEHAVRTLCQEFDRTQAYWREYVTRGKAPAGKEP